ncbi:CapA family protein [Bradyrhizobium sp. CIR3A]|uniref:CapA family protein n=1 Tax=Bradyrhizobium sp. CIR3A TaxID=2663838 RepID=UPI00160663D3|nr:CapA family protein [Bradyrhizobium sp. CIR3A]MBB4264222.1 poly-gamma-glutamate synthesis protein (capsule biosynthesis protein) [Bradyrhizobium sp. CIR3A]
MTTWTFGAVGDVFIDRPNPERAFTASGELLRQLDLVFGNCEGAYTDNPIYPPSVGWRVVAPNANGADLQKAGFHVMAVANNHCVDGGHVGLLDTLRQLRGQGIQTIGAGANLPEALAPATFERKGAKIGFIGFASVYPSGYEARTDRPGLAPMRVHYWINTAYGLESGVPPHIRSNVYPEDVELMKSIIEDLRKQVDIVVVSHHWGQYRSVYLTEYERSLARVAIDGGADIVLGHHHHFLRGIELYKDKPIFYGLGHFVFDLTGAECVQGGYLRQELGDDCIFPRPGYPLSPFPEDTRMTMVATCDFDGKMLTSVGFFPCMIDEKNHASPLKLGDPRAEKIADYMSTITFRADLKTNYGPITERLGFAHARVL